MTSQIGTPTGWVIATPDAPAARTLWHAALGFSDEHETAGELPSREHAASGQRVTVAEFAEPNPPVALAVRCEDIDASLAAATEAGLSEYWRDTSDSGTQFIMCRAEPGVFILLYQRHQ